MILRITNKCFMECNHCFMNSVPDGMHMNDMVFDQCVKFINAIGPMVVIISGGEPTTHPNIIDWIKRLQGPRAIILASNGMFLDDSAMVKEIQTLCETKLVMVQITNDIRYYPKRINPIIPKEFDYEDNLRLLVNLGRAKTNNLPIIGAGPQCFNLRSIARSDQACSFKSSVKMLESMHKFCQPSINYDGTIAAGESGDCHIIGNVYDSDDVLYRNLRNMKCDTCGSVSRLSALHKFSIGE